MTTLRRIEPVTRECAGRGGGYFGRGNFEGWSFGFQIGAEIPPRNFLRILGHFLLPASAANIFVL